MDHYNRAFNETFLGVNLTKHVQNLNAENPRVQIKKGIVDEGMDILCVEVRKFNMKKLFILPN